MFINKGYGRINTRCILRFFLNGRLVFRMRRINRWRSKVLSASPWRMQSTSLAVPSTKMQSRGDCLQKCLSVPGYLSTRAVHRKIPGKFSCFLFSLVVHRPLLFLRIFRHFLYLYPIIVPFFFCLHKAPAT